MEDMLTKQEGLNEEIIDEKILNTDKQIIKDYFFKDTPQTSIKELANLFGQSEGEMSKEFGTFKAKKLYKKLDYLILDNTLFYEEFIKKCALALRYGFKGVTVLPSFVARAKSSLVDKNLEVRALIDYPLGENLYKSRVYSVKLAIKNGASAILVALPTSAIKNGEYKKTAKEFNRIFKICKKRKVSVLIDFSKLNVNEVKPFIEKIVKDKRLYSIIPYNGFNSIINFQAIKDVEDLVEGKCIVEGSGLVESATEIVTAINSGASEILSIDCPFIAEDLDGKINTIN